MSKSITLMGASYPDVPAVVLPQTGSGTATFYDVSDTTAAAGDVAAGKYFFTASGVLTLGTGTGGGGGSVTQDQDGYIVLPSTGGGGGGGNTGLVYESGSVTPVSDVSTMGVTFSDTHSSPPCYMIVSDTEETVASTASNLFWYFVSWYDANGAYVPTSSSANEYGRIQFFYKTNSGRSYGQYDLTSLGSSTNTSLNYFVGNDGADIYCGSPNRFWRSGRTYKWLAVWPPET